MARRVLRLSPVTQNFTFDDIRDSQILKDGAQWLSLLSDRAQLPKFAGQFINGPVCFT